MCVLVRVFAWSLANVSVTDARMNAFRGTFIRQKSYAQFTFTQNMNVVFVRKLAQHCLWIRELHPLLIWIVTREPQTSPTTSKRSDPGTKDSPSCKSQSKSSSDLFTRSMILWKDTFVLLVCQILFKPCLSQSSSVVSKAGNKARSQLLWLTYACIIDFSHTNTLVQLHVKSTMAVKHKVCAALRRLPSSSAAVLQASSTTSSQQQASESGSKIKVEQKATVSHPSAAGQQLAF